MGKTTSVEKGSAGERPLIAQEIGKRTLAQAIASIEAKKAKKTAETGLTPEEREALQAQRAFLESATAAQKAEEARAQEMWNLYKSEFQPREIAFARQAYAGMQPSQAAAQAAAGVTAGFARERRGFERGLSRFGIAPTAPRFAALQEERGLAEATARAGAATTARREVADINFLRRLQSVQMGRDIAAGVSPMRIGAVQLGGAGLEPLSRTATTLGSRQFEAQQAGLTREFEAQQGELNRQTQLQIGRMEARSARRQATADLIGSGAGLIGSIFGGSRKPKTTPGMLV